MSKYIIYIYIDIILAFFAMKSVSNGKFFSTSPSLCWRCSGRNTGWTNKARTLPLRKPTPLAPKVFDPPMLENKHGKRKGLVNDKDLPLHFLWCLFVFMFIVSLVFLVLFFLVFGGSVFVFNDEIHLGKGSSHNFRGNLQVVFSKSLRTWVSFGCPRHVVLSVAIMVFPDHLFPFGWGQGRKTSRWTLGVFGSWGGTVVRKKRRRRSRSLPCPLDHFRDGIFASAAYASPEGWNGLIWFYFGASFCGAWWNKRRHARMVNTILII